MALHRRLHPAEYEHLHRKSVFASDSVLTQSVSLVARLHRAVLRNWHHMRMMLHNLAGVDEATKGSPNALMGSKAKGAGGIREKSVRRFNNPSLEHDLCHCLLVRSISSPPRYKYEYFQCRVHLKGLGESFVDRPHWCRAGKKW